MEIIIFHRGDACTCACLQTWLDETKTNIGQFPTTDFLNENDSLAYFEILG